MIKSLHFTTLLMALGSNNNTGDLMLRLCNSIVSAVLLTFSLLSTALISTQALAQRIDQAQAEACQALEQVRNLTITSAAIRDNSQANNPYCYVRGIISPAIHF
ncbi:MAG: hypothetical protein QGG54_16775, partial [Gammaproteobacteria bacterium]|nr:hypothetical protein [Gammaproteobacteria bacterium]